MQNLRFITLSFYILLVIYNTLGCSSDISKDTSLKKLSEEEVIKKLGPPTRSDILKLTSQSTLPEYQSDIMKFATELKESDTLEIKELYWENKNYNQVVWLKKSDMGWKTIYNLKWSKDIQF